MRKLAVFAMASICFAAAMVPAHAANEPYAIVKGTATIDGSTADFIKAGAVPIVLKGSAMAYATVEDVDGLSALAYFMYDSKNLYVAVDVVDSSMDFGRDLNNWWDQDAIEFFIGAKQFAMVIDPETNAPAWGNTALKDATRAVSVKKTATGWSAEGAINIADLNDMGDTVLAPGATVQFSIGVDRSMSPEGGRVGLLYFPIGWAWGNVDTFATGTLAK